MKDRRYQTAMNQEPPNNQLCSIVISRCLGHFWFKMVANKENIMVQCLTCMSSISVNIETGSIQTAWPLTLASKRLISQRGNVRIIRTDNGTNFAGANIELRKSFNKTNHTIINNFLMKLGGKWVTWRQNPKWEATWKDIGSVKFAQLEIYSTYCW